MLAMYQDTNTDLLPTTTADVEEKQSPRPFFLSQNNGLSKQNSLFIILNIAGLLLNLLLLSRYMSAFVCRESGSSVTGANEFPPASSSWGYRTELKDTHDVASSSYVGEPRRELDEAWSNLLEVINIKVSEDEMRAMNKTSVVLRDGSGYLGYLESVHMLHCVKRMYQFRHLDYYSDVDQDSFALPHWDHCVEVLRQGIMCNADTRINTYVWKEPNAIQGTSHWPRKCINWDGFMAWAEQRATRQATSAARLIDLIPDGETGSIGPLDP